MDVAFSFREAEHINLVYDGHTVAHRLMQAHFAFSAWLPEGLWTRGEESKQLRYASQLLRAFMEDRY